ncbi:MAG: outer membrane beta-barrel protein [Saprospiraceae bacterium]|nr:outer membrane beta-barrel protein [Saprospiraceae bacterium]
MKKFLVFTVALCCSIVSMAQVKFGLRGGVSSIDFNPKELVVLNQNDVEQLKISVNEISYGYHFGLFAQFRRNRWIVQPEVLFNSNKISYNVDDNILLSIKNEKFNFVDMPINIGYKLGPLRIQAGPVAHFFVNSASELKTLEGYKENFDNMALGVQYGLGLDIWKAVLDFKWERNYERYGDHVVFNDTEYNFNTSPTRFIVSLGIKF